jgi:hypothetical protein
LFVGFESFKIGAHTDAPYTRRYIRFPVPWHWNFNRCQVESRKPAWAAGHFSYLPAPLSMRKGCPLVVFFFYFKFLQEELSSSSESQVKQKGMREEKDQFPDAREAQDTCGYSI